MEFSQKYKELGEIIIQKFRDENFEDFLRKRDFAKSMSSEEYYMLPKNLNYDRHLQKIDDERFEFLNGLNEKQIEILSKIILNVLDCTAFNFLREIEENLEEDKSIGLTINGDKVENISSELSSGTFFGEYFAWIEKNSKYGPFQH